MSVSNLVLTMVMIILIMGCLLWDCWLGLILFAGLVYIRIGWQMIIWRRKMAGRIYRDVIARDVIVNYRKKFIPYFKYAFIFPFSFFAMNFTTEVLKLENKKAKWPLNFLIGYKKKAPWYYKVFVAIFWLPLLIYGATICIVITIVWTLCALVYGFFKKIIFLVEKIIYFAKIPDRHDPDPDDDDDDGEG